MTTSLSGGTVNTSYTGSLTATGGQGGYEWSLTGGALPPGLVLDTTSTAETTSLSGTPTTVGVFEFTIDVASGGNNASQTFSIDIGGGATLVEGWTEFVPQPGALTIYVSAAGNDANPGTQQSPRRTLAGGFALLREGQPDWLLLRRGDTFNNASGNFVWTKTGPATGPGWMRLGAYGPDNDPRPIIETGDYGIVVTPGFQSSRRTTNLAFTDVHLLSSTRIANPAAAGPGTYGIFVYASSWQGTGPTYSNLLFENLHIQGHTFGFSCQGVVQNIAIRRNIFHYIFNRTGDASGILAQSAGLLIEENFFYQIQSPDIPGLGSTAYAQRCHAAYIVSDSTNVVTRGNIMVKTPDGLMQRAGGTYTRNVSAFCNVAGLMGQAWGSTPVPGGCQSIVEENLLLNPHTTSFVLGNTATGQVTDNLFVRDLSGAMNVDLWMISRNTTTTGVNIGVHNTVFSGNLLSGQFLWNPADTTSFSGLTFSNNQVNLGQVNTSIAAYLVNVGWPGTTVDDWATQLLARDRDNFTAVHQSSSVINFYREQMGLGPLE